MIEAFDTRQAASRAAAQCIEKYLLDDLRQKNTASIAVSGGSSPRQCLEALAATDLPWSQVKVTLTDERQVPADDPASNEGMLRRHLFSDYATSATFVPIDEAAGAALPLPFSSVLCGMGSDGHFASIFPDLARREELLAAENTHFCSEIQTAASPYKRITLTLASLLRSRVILLLIFGEEKRRVLDNAEGLPVSALLQQTQTPLRILWAP